MTRGPFRLQRGGEIDRNEPMAFSFDGRAFQGFRGDTIASAILAGGVRVIGRSFKYHRPRGIWSAGIDEPNGIADVTVSGADFPNTRLTTEPLLPGMSVRSVNAFPNAGRDLFAAIEFVRPLIAAGFYYKTFMWPHWHRFEPMLRNMAGLGRLGKAPKFARSCEIHTQCDLLVVGAGPAGLAAAVAASRRGLHVVLADRQTKIGGSLCIRQAEISEDQAPIWVAGIDDQLRSAGNVTILHGATAFGIYDHKLVGIVQRQGTTGGDQWPERLWQVRARQIVIATGAIEQPMLFSNNDRPNIMSSVAALTYLRRQAVMPGRSVVVATNNDSAYETALALAQSGGTVVLLDSREVISESLLAAAREAGIEVRPETVPVDVDGRMGVETIAIAQTARKSPMEDRLKADSLLVSGGWAPTAHLYCQAGGSLRWENAISNFVPDTKLPGISVVGAANGTFDLSTALLEGHQAGGGDPQNAPRSKSPRLNFDSRSTPPRVANPGRTWIDLQSDVTASDLELAARENFTSVEHLKRYTTLGMATDQGKTANSNGILLSASLLGKAVTEVGTTTYRPPFIPVSFQTLTAMKRGDLLAPLRRLPAEFIHRSQGCAMGSYGGWLRPSYYGPEARAAERIAKEAFVAREHVALFDASPLGKIEILGPDAAKYLDMIYCNRVSDLKPGRCRYSIMLHESGIVFDDGVVSRLAENRFLISCSSSHTTAVLLSLEQWRQDRFAKSEVHIHNVTDNWGTITITGPKSKSLVAKLHLQSPVDVAGLPHMSIVECRLMGRACRIARVSFSGDRSYEISVPAAGTADWWQQFLHLGEELGAEPLGIEAMAILRAEKGYVIVGKDTDGMTMPHDLGFVSPRFEGPDEFVGKRSLFTEEASRPKRRQLVGLEVGETEQILPPGSHGIESLAGRLRSIGYVTSSYLSPTLKRPIALALIEGGASRHGETISLQHLGLVRVAKIVPPCAFDRERTRLHA